MTDYQSALYDPIYLIQGVPVVLILSETSELFDLTALDKTSGIDVGDGGIQVQTIKPAAALRMAEILDNGITVEELPEATVEMNGFSWNVTSYRLRPSPMGENDGEVLLILSDKTPISES